MFVKVTKNREGTQYISIVEGYREGNKVKQRTIQSLGKLKDLEVDNPNFLKELKEAVKAGKYQPTSTTLELSLDLEKTISNPLKNYGWLLLDSVYRTLGISSVFNSYKKQSKSKIDLNQVMKLLLAQRVLDPKSKLRSVQSQNQLFGDFNFAPQDIYRALDSFALLSEDIQLQMHQSISKTIGRSGALVFYDVTNYYFETDLDDETTDVDGESVPAFRKRGASKEKRPNPIVQMGLFMDTNGIPIAYRLFPGNCVDVKTYLPAVEQIKKQFGLERIVVVADKGLNSKENISDTVARKDGYLFSQKVRGTRGAPKDIQAFVLDSGGWQFNDSQTFAHKSFIRTRVVDKKEITEKVLATWNQKYDFREKIRRKKSVEYAEKLTAGDRFRMTMKKGGKRYLDVDTLDEETGEIKDLTPHITIDEEQISFDEQFDGINVLITSEIEMNDNQLVSNYRSLSRIEDCFKVLKTNFEARTVYVWTKPRIEAHFLICFIALTILRIMELKTDGELSPERIQAALKSAQCRPLEKGYWEVFGNEDFQTLNRLLEIPWDKQYVQLEKLRKYGR